MDNKLPFYGTPLLKLLPKCQDEKEGSYKARRSRLTQVQTVKDAQGRLRFHGAFTGGFSAGYFNTVSSKEGFKPKQFISHRGDRQNNETIFSHKPEDYMDEEDLDEFGIAPEKVRILNSFSRTNNNPSPFESVNQRSNSLKNSKYSSLGEKILKRMNPIHDQRDEGNSEATSQADRLLQLERTGFHGLGYKSLDTCSKSDPSDLRPSLVTSTERGKRVKISGEAFGIGVIDEDDDYIANTAQLYGLDNMNDYDFDDRRRFKTNPEKLSASTSLNNSSLDADHLPGFCLTERLVNMSINDYLAVKYPLPPLPQNWPTPKRSTAVTDPLPDNEKLGQKSELSRLSSRFTTEPLFLNTDSINTKSGLVKYCELKKSFVSSSRPAEVSDLISLKPTIIRTKTTWKPCSLLCKRFDVPVPQVEEKIYDLKLVDQTYSADSPSDSQTVHHLRTEGNFSSASMEARRSIFNVFSHFEEDDFKPYTETDSCDSESDLNSQLPYLASDSAAVNDQSKQRSSIDDSDPSDEVVVLCSKSRKKPEVVTISGSSSASSSPHTTVEKSARKLENDDSSDDYGPALPPSRATLGNLESRHRDWMSTVRREGRKKKHHTK